MKKPVIVQYDSSDKNFYDMDGTAICYCDASALNLGSVEEMKKVDIVELVKLGVTADEIVKMKNNGVL